MKICNCEIFYPDEDCPHEDAEYVDGRLVNPIKAGFDFEDGDKDFSVALTSKEKK